MNEIPTARSLAGVWLTLLVLLGITTASAYLQLGVGNTIINFAVAAAKVALIAAVFMHLRHSNATVRMAAGTALFFLLVLAFLSFGEFLTRSLLPADWKAPDFESNFHGSYDVR
jgi:cytochrome c oxidase subunit 4